MVVNVSFRGTTAKSFSEMENGIALCSCSSDMKMQFESEFAVLEWKYEFSLHVSATNRSAKSEFSTLVTCKKSFFHLCWEDRGQGTVHIFCRFTPLRDPFSLLDRETLAQTIWSPLRSSLWLTAYVICERSHRVVQIQNVSHFNIVMICNLWSSDKYLYAPCFMIWRSKLKCAWKLACNLRSNYLDIAYRKPSLPLHCQDIAIIHTV